MKLVYSPSTWYRIGYKRTLPEYHSGNGLDVGGKVTAPRAPIATMFKGGHRRWTPTYIRCAGWRVARPLVNLAPHVSLISAVNHAVAFSSPTRGAELDSKRAT